MCGRTLCFRVGREMFSVFFCLILYSMIPLVKFCCFSTHPSRTGSQDRFRAIRGRYEVVEEGLNRGSKGTHPHVL